MRSRDQRGVVLLVVLFFALLLTSGIATFTRRSTVDAIVSRNRESVARAEALARGGIRLATSLIIHDRYAKQSSGLQVDSHLDGWHRLRDYEVPVEADSAIRLLIDDSGSKLNLNALFDYAQQGVPYAETEPFLLAFFDKVIDELPIPPGESELYDANELAEDLMDWVDTDDVRLEGGFEDDFYQQQDPPYRAANQPLLSVDDLLLIRGFDRVLVDGLRPYVTVYPFVGGEGINLNTAPPHVLSLIYYNDGVDDRLIPSDRVQQILDVRDEGGVLCGEGQSHESCTPIRSIVENPIFPPPSYAASVFTVTAEARAGDVRRGVAAVLDVSSGTPQLLSWKVR